MSHLQKILDDNGRVRRTAATRTRAAVVAAVIKRRDTGGVTAESLTVAMNRPPEHIAGAFDRLARSGRLVRNERTGRWFPA